MKKSNISRYLLFIGFATFFTIIVTIIQKSYSNLIGPINQVKTSGQIKPIDPNLDIATLDELEGRLEYTADDLNFSLPLPSEAATSEPGQANDQFPSDTAPQEILGAESDTVSDPAVDLLLSPSQDL